MPEDRYERAQVLQWMFFEQYDHEPSIAVVRFWVAYSGPARGVRRPARGADGRGLPGARRDGAPPRRARVLRRRRRRRSPTSRCTPTRTWRPRAASTSRVPGDPRVDRAGRGDAGPRPDRRLSRCGEALVAKPSRTRDSFRRYVGVSWQRRRRRTKAAKRQTKTRRSPTPWGAAVVVEEVEVPQRSGEKRFATLVQLLESDGRASRSFASRTRPTESRGEARSRCVARDLERLRTALAERPALAAAFGLVGGGA